MKAGLLKLAGIVVGLNLIFLCNWSLLSASIGIPASSSPPRSRRGISPEELIQTGEKVVFGKGQCMVCHPANPEAGMRAPAMATIGREMEKEARERNLTPEDYVFEALVNPSKYVVKGFEDIMPPRMNPPTSLTEGELIAVSAYLQSKGGKVSISYPASLPILKKEIEKAARK